MDRKKFFKKFSIAVAGLTLVKFNPIRLFIGKTRKRSTTVKVELNQLAVKREKSGVKNG